MKKIVYADHSATTYVKPEVLNAMLPYYTSKFANPSSSHSLGAKNKEDIEVARKNIAHMIGAHTNEIYFTSGGSEADNLIIYGIAMANYKKGTHIITSKIEHLAVLNTCKYLETLGFEVTYLDVDKNGLVDIDDLKAAIREDTILISIMMANNEIGTIQDIQKIAKIAKDNNIYMHTDAVQAFGSIEVNVEKLGIDALSISAHKFYGPKGVGIAYIRNGIEFLSLIKGGHQENNKRAGTENVAGIIGMQKAMELAVKNLNDYSKRLCTIRNYVIDRILKEIPESVLNGDKYSRLPGNVNISFKGIDGKSLLLMLDMKGIECSTGSACTSNISGVSHVLKAIGLPENYAIGTIRLSFGACNSLEDAKYIIQSLKECLPKCIKKMSKN